MAPLCWARSAMVARKVRTSPKLLAPDQAPTISLASSASGPMSAILLIAGVKGRSIVLRGRIVLQQHQRFLRRPAGKWAMLGNCSRYLRTVSKRVFEETERELQPQDAAHGFVGHSHRHAARLDQSRQLGVVVVRHHVDVYAGHQGLLVAMAASRAMP